MNLRLMYCLVISLLLVGCACFEKQPETAIDQKREIKFDKRLLKKCDTLQPLTTAREKDVHKWIKETIKSYEECSVLKEEENTEIKKALNLKD